MNYRKHMFTNLPKCDIKVGLYSQLVALRSINQYVIVKVSQTQHINCNIQSTRKMLGIVLNLSVNTCPSWWQEPEAHNRSLHFVGAQRIP